MSIDQDIAMAIVAILVAITIAFDVIKPEPEPQSTSILTGHAYYLELMSEDCNENTFLTVARMPCQTFKGLLSLLHTHGGLDDSYYITAGEKLMIYMHVLTGFSVRQIGVRWQHSTSTISSILDEVIFAIMRCKHLMMIPVGINEVLSPKIRDNFRFYPYFQNCDGALDGSHIPARVRGHRTNGASSAGSGNCLPFAIHSSFSLDVNDPRIPFLKSPRSNKTFLPISYLQKGIFKYCICAIRFSVPNVYKRWISSILKTTWCHLPLP